MDLLGYGVVSGLGGLASTLFGNMMSQSMSKDMMDYQYQLQQKAIDRANLYNSPAEQMKRLAAAGLSPNLVYGSGVDGNQSQPASVSQANRRAEIANPLQDIGQAYLQQKQLDLEQIRARNEAFESRARRLNIEAKTIGQLLDNKFLDSTMDTRVKLASQRLANEVANEALTWSKTRNEDNRLEQIFAETERIKADKHLTDERALTEAVKRNLYNSNIRVNDAQCQQIAAMIPYINAGTDLRTQNYEQTELMFESTDELNKWLAEHPNVELTVDIIKEILGAGNGSSGRHKAKTKRKRKS